MFSPFCVLCIYSCWALPSPISLLTIKNECSLCQCFYHDQLHNALLFIYRLHLQRPNGKNRWGGKSLLLHIFEKIYPGTLNIFKNYLELMSFLFVYMTYFQHKWVSFEYMLRSFCGFLKLSTAVRSSFWSVGQNWEGLKKTSKGPTFNSPGLKKVRWWNVPSWSDRLIEAYQILECYTAVNTPTWTVIITAIICTLVQTTAR